MRRPILRRPWIHEVITINDDFTDRKTDVRHLLKSRRPLAVFVQEGKEHDFALEVPRRYDVCQDTRTKARAGVAIIYDRKKCQPVGYGCNNPRKLGWGIQLIAPGGDGIMGRFVVWRDVEVGKPGSGRIVRLASYHRRPHRARATWPRDDANLREWLDLSPVPVVLGCDANTKTFKIFARRVGARARGRHVDAVLITGRVKFRGRAWWMPRRRSDHRPFSALIRIPRSRKKRKR